MSNVTLHRDELVADATRHLAANTRLTEFGDWPHLMADFAMMIAARVAVRMTPPPEQTTLRASLAAVVGLVEAATAVREMARNYRSAGIYAAWVQEIEMALDGPLAAYKQEIGG